MMRSTLLVGLTLLFLGRTAIGQPAAKSTPRGRGHHTLFYDEVRQRVMLTNGTTVDDHRNYELLNDLWSFDGTAWTELPSSGERLSGTRVDTDAQQRIYAFGGWTGSSIGTLRVLENDRWRTIMAHPSIVTAEHGFVFDAARNRFMAFGGGAGPGQTVAEVWEYDGARWTKSTATPPPARSSHAMAYDARRKKTVVFGGMGVRHGDEDTPILADTWEFDGITWKQRQVTGPPPRLGPGVTYDSKRGLVLIFGGSNERGVLNDLWAWDGTSWKKLAENGPEPRVMGYIAYDKKRDRVVLFGGRRGVPANTDLADTWEWDGASWHRVGN